jgi:hypothetical protein
VHRAARAHRSLELAPAEANGASVFGSSDIAVDGGVEERQLHVVTISS